MNMGIIFKVNMQVGYIILNMGYRVPIVKEGCLII